MSRLQKVVAVIAGVLAAYVPARAAKKEKVEQVSPLDRYVEEAMSRQRVPSGTASGSLWSPSSRLTDLGSDLRASQIDDMVTILVTERASAVAKGNTKTARQSSTKASISAAGGITRATGPLVNLAGASGDTQLNGEGTTSRETALSTTLSARISQVLPNGYLVLEGNKDVMVNSERQIVTVRGVIRPADLSTGNLIRSDQIAQMEIRVNGKGVIGDAIRRPFILYRILLGLLPF
jgi:flagellar L-ring protein precursor FlgH